MSGGQVKEEEQAQKEEDAEEERARKKAAKRREVGHLCWDSVLRSGPDTTTFDTLLRHIPI